MTRGGAAPGGGDDVWTLDARGWCTAAEPHRSPNCDERPAGPIDLLVIHSISLPPGEYGGDQVRDLFLNQLDCRQHAALQDLEGLRVSSHFFIRRSGALLQFVGADARAWHAGVSQFAQRKACNDFSIGVELEGIDSSPFEDAQYATLARLARCLCSHYALTDVAAHSEIAPGRKTDPGPHFNWARFLSASATGLRHTAP